MTKRQLEVLRMVREAMQKGEPWINLGLSSTVDGREQKITWEELNWVSDFEKQAMLTRIDAALLIDDAVHAMRDETGRRVLEGDPAEFCEVDKKGAEVTEQTDCAPWAYPRCAR